ncbi:hypothetical protein KIH74_10005 [Kineosporia sp. J2-2]|uniref:Uncharacterized protein n=1 Tax=Kineosporia corallincola TaxID=2835133 RepID=A0ABS5TI37_9ACTN|nr:hypothetical protein [Kineosporia corallincola]MBT0769254.1 hypothetical protein [Kineosporia corallincola]
MSSRARRAEIDWDAWEGEPRAFGVVDASGWFDREVAYPRDAEVPPDPGVPAPDRAPGEFRAQFWERVAAAPDDALITVVGCHY